MKLSPNRVAVPLPAQHEEAGKREDEHREPKDQLGLLLARGHADHQQRHGADRQGQLGKRHRQLQG